MKKSTSPFSLDLNYLPLFTAISLKWNSICEKNNTLVPHSCYWVIGNVTRLNSREEIKGKKKFAFKTSYSLILPWNSISLTVGWNYFLCIVWDSKITLFLCWNSVWSYKSPNLEFLIHFWYRTRSSVRNY